MLDRLQAAVVGAETVTLQLFAFLAKARKVEIHAAMLCVFLHAFPEVARPCNVGLIVPRPRSRLQSIDSMYGIERSPNAVASAGTRAVAPPKFQIDDRVFGDGGFRFAATISSMARSESPLRYRLFQ